jgi:hypothetical protein
MPRFRPALASDWFMGSKVVNTPDLLGQLRRPSLGFGGVLALIALGFSFLLFPPCIVFRASGSWRHVLWRAAQPWRRVISNHAPGHIGA